MKRLKGYKYRIYPNEQQKEFFSKSFGCVRFVYNRMLNDRIEAYQSVKQNPAIKMEYPTPAQYKKEFAFLKEPDSLALANAQINLNKAYNSFFKGENKFPNFKSKKNPIQSYTTNNQKGTVAVIGDKYLRLPKIKERIRIRIHRPYQGEIRSATVSRHSSGKYYVSILCKHEIAELTKTNRNIGIDLGISDFAIFSDGTKHDNNRFSTDQEKKLKFEQRKLSRRALLAKKSGKKLFDCKNYQKQKIKVARLREKVAFQRKDFLHKLSTNIVKNHDIICIENLNVRGMVKNKKLSKSISDVSWSEFSRQLEYKSKWYGKELIKIDQWFPSSQICSTCGHQDGKKPLHVREWTCTSCGSNHDRDLNASINILNEGLKGILETAV
ncbi:mobile element protein [Bacillus sp. JCM 19047]|nr:mobile element protein [Bacillus sp. JCM 19047]